MSASTGLKMNAANFPVQSRFSDVLNGVVRHNHAVAVSDYIAERGYCVTVSVSLLAQLHSRFSLAPLPLVIASLYDEAARQWLEAQRTCTCSAVTVQNKPSLSALTTPLNHLDAQAGWSICLQTTQNVVWPSSLGWNSSSNWLKMSNKQKTLAQYPMLVRFGLLFTPVLCITVRCLVTSRSHHAATRPVLFRRHGRQSMQRCSALIVRCFLWSSLRFQRFCSVLRSLSELVQCCSNKRDHSRLRVCLMQAVLRIAD